MDPVIAQKSPYRVDLVEGESYAWCTCGQSDSQPFCSGAHKAAGEFKPMRFTAAATESKALCGCKHSKNAPYCDGTHRTLA